jgi:hypothetical protein
MKVKRTLLSLLLAFALLTPTLLPVVGCAPAALAAKNMYWADTLTGGGTGALDAIDGAGLNDGDSAVVVSSDAVYFYRLNATSGVSESPPFVISPDSNPSTKRWILIPPEHPHARLPELGADPSAVTDKGLLYSKDNASVTDLYFRNTAGVQALTGSGSLFRNSHNSSGGHNPKQLYVVNGSNTLTASHDLAYGDATSAATTINLPALATVPVGKWYWVFSANTSAAYPVRILGNGTEQIYYRSGGIYQSLGSGVPYVFPMTGRVLLMATSGSWVVLTEEFGVLQDNADRDTPEDTGVNDLASVTLPANALRVGDVVEITAASSSTGTAGQKIWNLYFGATQLINAGSSSNAGEMNALARVAVTGSSSQKATTTRVGTPAASAQATYTAPSESISSNIVIKTTGYTASTADEVINRILVVRIIR